MAELSNGGLLGILALLLLMSAFFSGSETSMMALNRYRLRHRARQGYRSAKLISAMIERPDRLLGIILIGNTYANLQAAAIATVIAVNVWGENGINIATVCLTVVVLIFAEVMPKTIAATHPQKFATIVVYPLWLLLKLLYPVVWLANSFVNGVLGLVGLKVKKHTLDHLSSEELKTVVHEAGSKIDSDHQDMLLRIFDLEKMSIDDVMVPRNKIMGIDLSEPWEKIIAQLTSSQYTRMPVYEDNLENVHGMLHVRHALNLLAQQRLNKKTLKQATSEVFFVPESTPITTQLLNLREAKQRVALVVDEYGDIQGLIALEDILEEIVGEFTTDVAKMHRQLGVMQEDGRYLVTGGVHVRDLNRERDWNLPTDGPKTVSGLIVEVLETIPSPGTWMKIGNYTIEVVQVRGNRITQAAIGEISTNP